MCSSKDLPRATLPHTFHQNISFNFFSHRNLLILLSALNSQYINSVMSSWYGKTSSKQLDQLIDKKSKLSELFLYPDFINELKAYNTKLLEYLSTNTILMTELVQLLTVAPTPTDSEQRKYKLPLVAIQAIQTQTTCIHNSLFKQSSNGSTYFENLFKLLDSAEVLSLLAAYLFRANTCLLNNRQKQTLDKIYSMPHIFTKLIDHSYHMPIANIIQIYINLDINKHQNIGENEGRTKLKLQVLQQIISKIQVEISFRSEKSTMIIENLCGILCETIEKYYLIINGKQMIEYITSEKCIQLFMSMIRSPFLSENSIPGFNFFISLINYYSFSSFNVDDLNSEDGKRNLQRLQTQPMIIELTNYFSSALDRIMRAPVINVYLYKLLEVLCHCISISSIKILECTRKTQFFNNLVKLMFTHEKQNILHVLIQKSFLHIFISDRKIYYQYRKHLFCEIDIIDSTAGYFMKQFPLEKLFQEGRKRAYFGHFMRILKIYSGIQTEDNAIIQAIKSKSELWNKISKNLIVPFENIYQKKLGTYDQVPQPVVQEFKVDKNLKFKPNPMKISTIQQINKEQNVPAIIKSQIQLDPYTKMQQMEEKQAQQIFYRTPIQGFLTQNQIISTNSNTSNLTNSSVGSSSNNVPLYKPPLPVRPQTYMSQSNVIDYQTSNTKQLKKSESFKDFMDKKKVEAEQEIKMKRSLSQEKRLSGSKTKLLSPAHQKKNSWKQQSTQELSKQQTEKKHQVPGPKIPLNRKPVTHGSLSQRLHLSAVNSSNLNSVNNSFNSNSSGINNLFNRSGVKDESTQQVKMNTELQLPGELRKIKIIQIEKPSEKKYRRIEKKDEPLLNFLGLSF